MRDPKGPKSERSQVEPGFYWVRSCLRMLWDVDCDKCDGAGYFETEDDPAEQYCDCLAGLARRAKDGDTEAVAKLADAAGKCMNDRGTLEPESRRKLSTP